MEPHEFERLKRAVALDLAKKSLENADFSKGTELLTADELDAYLWLEMLYYDGEISYRELWRLCSKRHSSRET